MADPAGADLIADDSAASKAWTLLRANHKTGMGPTKVSKLLARKRPKLLPVSDSVVRCAVGRPDNWWSTLRGFLTDESVGGAESVQRLRTDAAVPARVSDLRIVDVAVWMGHQADHRTGDCGSPSADAME